MTRAAVVTARPILADEAADYFASFAPYRHILLAVSGGADSIALMALARDWAKTQTRRAPKLSVATVDHGLRKEARDEAALVARFASLLRMDHALLTWRGVKPKSGIQEKARTARYDLLIAHARVIGAQAIALAHHADDQAETLLLRLAAGSGLSGLSGMKAIAWREDMPILRPLLDLPAARLRATVDERGIAFVDDPSNENDAYARVRMRKARDVLAVEGLSRERLQTLAHRLARADDALREIAALADARHEMPLPNGRAYAPSLFDEPLEILIRVVQGAVAHIGAGDEPMLHRLENKVLDLLAARTLNKSLKLTMGGAILSLSTDGCLKILPESPRRKV